MVTIDRTYRRFRPANAVPLLTHARLATAPASTMVSNMSPSISCSAPHNSATSYDGSATINSATVIAAASAILVVRIAVAAIVPTANNCPSSNYRSTAIDGGSSVNCGASVN